MPRTIFFLYKLICFVWNLNLLKPAPCISIDLHRNYEKEDSYEEWRLPKVPKRPKKTDCIIHCTDSSDALIQPNTLESWKSLVAAANFSNILLSWRYFLAVCNNSAHVSACFFLFCLFLQKKVLIKCPIFTTINYHSNLFT